MTEQTVVRGTVPEANPNVVEGAFRHALRKAAAHRDKFGPSTGLERVLLLRAAPEWRHPSRTLTVAIDGDTKVTAIVRVCPTVLSVLEALEEPRDEDVYLVVLTPWTEEELGDSVLAQALGNEVRTINRWDLVAEAFGARRLDPRLSSQGYRWVAEALIDAQPGSGWKHVNTPVLQLETVLRRLAAARFGKGEDERLDASALLEWSRDDLRVGRFAELTAEERGGLASWLETSIGPVARVVFRLLSGGQVRDSVPFGIAASELYAARRGKSVEEARIRAEERFFGGTAPDESSLRAFAEAAESLVLRWNDTGHATEAGLACSRAEQILAELRAGDLAGTSKVLDAGLDARLLTLADTIASVLPAPRHTDLAEVESALEVLSEHRRPGGRAAEVEAAHCAVRLVRWLASPEVPPTTVAEGVARQVRSWGWVDRAAAVLFNAGTARVPRAEAAYAEVFRAVRHRRAELDRAFAERLAAWSAASADPDRLLLAETLLSEIARPVADRAAPLIIVIDGMSAANASALAEEINATRTWREVGREPDGREGALAAIPSTTVFSRASLLCGDLTSGGQSRERRGFTALWRGRGAELFHKAGLGTGPGAQLSDDVRAAIGRSGTVVGVVLNSIDEALSDNFRVNAGAWRVDQIDYLPQLLAEAAAARRPIVLISDHGHVLEHGDGVRPVTAESARHRTGPPGDGEIAIRGRRVLTTGGEVTVPWDERIRYLARRAGYHGGASPAEMVIPVLVFVPSGVSAPKGWFEYETASLHEPAWWNPLPAPAPPPAATARASRRPDQDEGALFSVTEAAAAAAGLGAQVVASALFAAQRQFVRKAPPDEEVAALIDGLAEAGGKLPTGAAAALVGQPAFRMAGYLSAVGRLLNVDGYPVIGETDGGRMVELDVRLLSLQFLED
ncbi:BREX-2 system phosphatase PglZ [Actinomadura geliboluensis]|uniref:BREX-2 system phosphatase PglZ n=1 Tax=Actinomadura geliboluensis TaxID=882440 RepID=UPI00262F32C4|nr:BREX-2 system phosphatase PglZ [Actinomadura geliboluensis]